MFELTEIVRQANEIDFSQLLNRLREAKHTKADIESLKKFKLKFKLCYPQYPDAVHLFATNNSVNQFIFQILNLSKNHKLTYNAIDPISEGHPKGNE